MYGECHGPYVRMKYASRGTICTDSYLQRTHFRCGSSMYSIQELHLQQHAYTTVHDGRSCLLTFEPAGVRPLGVLERVGLVGPRPSLSRALLLSSLRVACSRCSSWWCATHPTTLRKRPRTTALPQLAGDDVSDTLEWASGAAGE